MKKNELMNGDIVVLSGGNVAVVIGEGNDAYLLYQHGGFEFLDEYYDEDLYNEIDEDMVMQVFRSNGGFGFEGVDQEVPIWERDESWECPTEHERDEQHRMAVERHEAEFKASLERIDETRKDKVFIVAQGFYGNRTGTEIRRQNLDRFILGAQTDDFTLDDPIDRTIIHLPGSSNVVLIYNRYKEAERLETKERVLREENYLIKPLASIPEMGLEIYSRCIACRLTAAGEFQSIENEDLDILAKYLAK